MKTALLGAVAALASLCLSPTYADQPLRFEHVMSIGGEGTGAGQFKYVEDLAFTRDGKLLVTDAVHAWVQVFDPATGKYLARFGGKGEDDANLDKPEGIAVAPDGSVFVAD